MNRLNDRFKPRGRVELFVTRGSPRLVLGPRVPHKNEEALKRRWPGLELPKMYRSCELDFSNTQRLSHTIQENILVDGGKDKVVESLTSGFINVVARMAIGDRGATPSDLTIPKVPTSDQSALFNEIYRADLDATVLNTGTPGVHEAQFIKTFDAVDIPLTAYSNQAQPVVNEVGLINADLLAGNPLPRPAVAAPGTPDADESLFSIRTFKSVPFEAANDTSITIRYTVFIE